VERFVSIGGKIRFFSVYDGISPN